VKAQVNVVSGGPAGTVHVFSKDRVSFGRHPDCDLQFDPKDDLQVSIRHAELVRSGEKWSVRDLGSSNGTFVNGHQITAETQLDPTDQIRFGRNGPLLEFKLVHEGTQDTERSQVAVTAQKSEKKPRSTETGERQPVVMRESNTEFRVRVEVAKQTRKLRTGIFFLAFVLVGVLGAANYVTNRQNQLAAEEMAVLRAQYDSVLVASNVTIQNLRGRAEGLASALQESRIQMRDLTNQLEQAEASGDADRVTSLTASLATLRAELNQQQSAAEIDHSAINAANQLAVGMVYVQYTTGESATGTAFAINPNGTMITNHHVVAGLTKNKRIRQMAVQFTNSEQVFPAQLLRASTTDSLDLALIQVRLGSNVQVVASINTRPDTIRVGAPTAMIGFPFGNELPMAAGERRPVASATHTAALVSKNIPKTLQLQGFGAPGGSGSPIFDANGEVIGVHFGGNRSAEVILGIRSDALLEFIGRN
jgi:S1-C subfamily serine protease